MQTRIYTVTERVNNKQRLVEAASAAQAIRHCAQGTFAASVATTKDVAVFMRDGVTVERAEAAQAPAKPEQA